MASKITNNSNGPRNINTTTGVVTLRPGETLGDEYEVDKANLAAMEKHGLLDPVDGASRQGGTSSIADVQREIASAAGSELTPNDLVGTEPEKASGGKAAKDDKSGEKSEG